MPGIEEVSAKMSVDFPMGILGRIAVSLDTSLPCRLVGKVTLIGTQAAFVASCNVFAEAVLQLRGGGDYTLQDKAYVCPAYSGIYHPRKVSGT